jgi:hypothetical protein
MSEIPEGVSAIFQTDDTVAIKFLSGDACYLTWGPMEFRFKKAWDSKGNLRWEWDEIVGTAHMHVEMMDDNYYWMGLTLPDGRSASIDIGAKRAPVRMTGWTEKP